MTRFNIPLKKEAARRERIGNLIPSSAKSADLIEMKHQQILKGALQLFIKKGFLRTTIREIAMASGMSMGQLYHYISCKDDILFLVYQHMEKMLQDYLCNVGIEEIKDPLEKLNRALPSILEFVVKHKKLNQFFYTETKFLEKKHLRVALKRFDNNVIGMWRRFLMDVNKQKPIKVDVNFAAVIISYLMFLIPLSDWSLKDKPTNEKLNYLLGFILRGLGITS
jgi:AcrR family transcriptional regulator